MNSSMIVGFGLLWMGAIEGGDMLGRIVLLAVGAVLTIGGLIKEFEK